MAGLDKAVNGSAGAGLAAPEAPGEGAVFHHHGAPTGALHPLEESQKLHVAAVC